MTRKHVAGARHRATALPGTGRATDVAGLNLFQLVALWRLYQGGIPVADGMRLLGVKVHESAARGAVKSLDTLMTLGLPINEPVRCGGCGSLLVQIPCVACRGRKQTYRMPEKRRGS